MGKIELTDERTALLETYRGCDDERLDDPRVGALVNELIGHVADKWTMIILEVLTAQGELRFTRLREQVPGISYKMLTQTLRMMEREGLITRTIHPVVPPKVEYKLTDLGLTLSAAFCGVWVWAEQHLEQVERARVSFDTKAAPSTS
jgi:DNA-binding HxlR family transcriptional regulator